MSLNGLDDPAIIEAYQTALVEAGGWFLLKYVSRDVVDLLGRGTGGVAEIRITIDNYDEKSPLYGFLQYRRRKIILRYVPEGVSRLIQARISVQFQSILDKFTPHDTVFSLSISSELTENALSSACLLHTASGSMTSSTSSLRRRRLGGITEDAEENDAECNESTVSVSGGWDNRRDSVFSGTSEATAVPPSHNYRETITSPPSKPESLSSVSRDAPESLSDKPLPSVPRNYPTSRTNGAAQKHFLDQLSQPVESRKSSQSTRPSLRDLDQTSLYKPKIKLGPRPSMDVNGRPKTAGSMHRSQEPRPVASLPAGIRSSGRKQPTMRPTSQPGIFPSAPSSPRIPPVPPLLIPPPPINIGSFSRSSPGSPRSVMSVPASIGATPEKQRLMRALEMRKRQLEKQATNSKKKAKQPEIEAQEDATPEKIKGDHTENESLKDTIELPPQDTTPEKTNDEQMQSVSLKDTKELPIQIANAERKSDEPTEGEPLEDIKEPSKQAVSPENKKDVQVEIRELEVTKEPLPQEVEEVLPDHETPRTATPESDVKSNAEETVSHIEPETKQGRSSNESEQETSPVPKIDDEKLSSLKISAPDSAVELGAISSEAVKEDQETTPAPEIENNAEETSTSKRAFSEIQDTEDIKDEILSKVGANAVEPSEPKASTDTEKAPKLLETSPDTTYVEKTEAESASETCVDTEAPLQSTTSPEVQNNDDAKTGVLPKTDEDGETSSHLDIVIDAEEDVKRPEPLTAQITESDTTKGDEASHLQITIPSNDSILGPDAPTPRAIPQQMREECEKTADSMETPDSNPSDEASKVDDVISNSRPPSRSPSVTTQSLTDRGERTDLNNEINKGEDTTGNSRIAKRRGILDPIQIVPHVEDSDEENLLSDDSFMDELGSATFQDAKPISVPKTPLGNGDTGSPVDRWKGSRMVSNSAATGSDVQALPVGRSGSGNYSEDHEAVPVLVAKKVSVSSGISKRIKALEMFSSNREPSTSPTPLRPTPSRSTSGTSPSALEKFRKRASLSQSPIPSSKSPAKQPSPTPEPAISPAPKRHDSVSTKSTTKNKSNSVSVTARIVRDSSSPPTDSPVDNSESGVLNLQHSDITVEHDSNQAAHRTSTSTAIRPDKRMSTSSAGSRRNSSTVPIPRSDSISSRLSVSKIEGTFSHSSSDLTHSTLDSVDEGKESKKESRKSRILRRMSSITSNSKRGIMHTISPAVKEEDAPAVQVHPPKETFIAPEPPQVVDIGEVNVQFPDTLLWKRRFMRIDNQGYLVLTPGTIDGTARNIVKRYHLSEFRMPCIPDQDRQELPNSIILDFCDGNTLQCACESRQAQKAVLQTLLEAHKANHKQY